MLFEKNTLDLSVKNVDKYHLLSYFNIPHPKNIIRRSEMANTFLAANEPGLAFVCFFGVAVVFIGLVILIGLVYLMNYLCDKFLKEKPQAKKEAVSAPVQSTEIPNREEIVAAVVAAIAEEEKTDISAIRVLSFKKV